MSPAHASGEVAGSEIFDLLRRGKVFVKGKDAAFIGVFRLFDTLRIGDDLHDGFAQIFGARKERDDIAIALAHLASIESDNGLRAFMSECLGQFQSFSLIDEIKALGDIDSHFDVLKLVEAHGHEIGVKEQDICRHENGIGKKSHVHAVVGVFASFVIALQHCFIGMSAVHQSFRRESHENGGELKGLRDRALTIDQRLFGIEATCQPGGGNFEGHRP